MKRMTELIFTAGFALVAAVLLCACSDKLDIQQVYEFDLATLPVQTTIVEGGEAEIRCQLVRSGRYEETEYFIRYFQRAVRGNGVFHPLLPAYGQGGASSGGRYSAAAQ